MAWTATEGSHVFRATMLDALANTAAFDLDTDVPKCALYTNTGTPDRNVSAALSAYNAATSQWVTANEKSNGNWTAGGVALSTTSWATGTNLVKYDAADVAPGGTVTLADVYGCLVYDDTLTTPVADQGLCFNFFGGAQSVTGGTFSVIWHANGIFEITV